MKDGKKKISFSDLVKFANRDKDAVNGDDIESLFGTKKDKEVLEILLNSADYFYKDDVLLNDLY